MYSYMYKDCITYRLADGISESHLFQVARRIYTQWMKNQPWFVSREIHTNDDGTYTDIVTWDTMEHAKQSEQHMIDIPDADQRYVCYQADSIVSRHLNCILMLWV